MKDLNNLYDRVFEEILENEEVLRRKRGLLYKIIQIILIEEKSQTQQETRIICNLFQIRDNAYEEEDIKVIKDLVNAVFIDRQSFANRIPFKDFFTNLSIKANQSLRDNNEEEKMKWFIITACALVGVISCIKYLEYVQQQKENKKSSSNKSKNTSVASIPIPAALCFVVPAKIVYDLQNGSMLTKEDVIQIAENAAYFNCTTIKKAEVCEEQLVLTNDEIKSDSQREVYIRIETDNGKDLISAETAYRLKRNLPTDSPFVVKQLACLKNLSGLEVFTRI